MTSALAQGSSCSILPLHCVHMAGKPEWADGFLKEVRVANQEVLEQVRQENRQALATLGREVKEVRDEQVKQGKKIKEIWRKVPWELRRPLKTKVFLVFLA